MDEYEFINVFKDRLKELIEESEFNQREVAGKIGISKQTISFYVNGKRLPDIDNTYKLCKFFHVSADYLLGLSDAKSFDIEEKAISEKLGLSDFSIKTLKFHNQVKRISNLISTINFLLEQVSPSEYWILDVKSYEEKYLKQDEAVEESELFRRMLSNVVHGSAWEDVHFDVLKEIGNYLEITCSETTEIAFCSDKNSGKDVELIFPDPNNKIKSSNGSAYELATSLMNGNHGPSFKLEKLLNSALLIEIQNKLQKLKQEYKKAHNDDV